MLQSRTEYDGESASPAEFAAICLGLGITDKVTDL